MSTPTIKINSDLPKIGIPFDPIILFFQHKVFLSYQLPLSAGNGKFGILVFDSIEFKVTPINDEGIGKHRFAKYGLRWYSIHEITNVEETRNWESHNAIYWMFTFKDRTFEILSPIPKVIERECTMDVVRNHVAEFSSILNDHF